MPDHLVFRLSVAETELIGRALGKMPYDDVCALISNLQRQARFEQTPPDRVASVEAAMAGLAGLAGLAGDDLFRKFTGGQGNGKEEGQPLREGRQGNGYEGQGQEGENESNWGKEAIARRPDGEG